MQFMAAAVRRGEKAAVFVFDEELGLLFSRMKTMDIDLEALQAPGGLHIEQCGGAFARRVCASRSGKGRQRGSKNCSDRQHQWLSGIDAQRACPDPAHA
jgi:hypothetical protein